MPRLNNVISDFSAGEIDSYFFGRTSLPVYAKGASQMINFMPRPQGGFRKRPGTLMYEGHGGHTGGPDNVAQLYAIKISAALSYILEFTNNLFRVWTYNGSTLIYSGISHATTYTTAELPQLQFAWLYPDIFIAHQNHAPARIRFNSTGPTFTLANVNFVTTSFTFTGNIVAGALSTISGIVLTAPAGQQTAVQLPIPSATQSGLWVLTDTGGVVAAGTYITQVYPSAVPSLSILAASASLSSAASGASAADTFTLTQANPPFQSAGNYPRCVSVAYQRVYWANTKNNPQTLYSSIIGVWDSGDPVGAAGNMNVNLFEAVTNEVPQMITDASGNPTSNPPTMQNQQQTQNAISDSDAISATLTSTQSELLWISSSHDLIIGAADGEVVISSNTGSVVGISPNTIADNQVSKAGSAAIQGEVLVTGMVFIGLAGLRVFELNWQGVTNSYDPPSDLSFFSTHLFIGNPITAWDYVQSPERIAYFLRTDGTLACLHYDPAFGIRAWWQFETRAGDVITSIAVSTGLKGDTLFLAVTRGAFNYVEMLSSPDWTNAPTIPTWCYLDAAAQATGVNLTTIAVDTSFNGVTLGVVADGVYLGTAVPAGGILTLPGGVKATYITAGLLPVTPIVKTLPIASMGQYGPGLSDIGTIDHVGLILFNTLDIQVGTDAQLIAQGQLETIPEVQAANGVLPTPFSGEPEPVAIRGTNIRERILDIQSKNPLPCEVTAIVPEVTLPGMMQR